MTDDQLSQLEALCAAATPWPWSALHYPEVPWGSRVVGAGRTVAESNTRDDAADRNDAAFIAAARTALPSLIAECRRLRAREQELMGYVGLRTANARLRAALEAVRQIPVARRLPGTGLYQDKTPAEYRESVRKLVDAALAAGEGGG